MRPIALERFHIVAHSYAASFSKKRVFMKLLTFFCQKLNRFTQKILIVPESAFKERQSKLQILKH